MWWIIGGVVWFVMSAFILVVVNARSSQMSREGEAYENRDDVAGQRSELTIVTEDCEGDGLSREEVRRVAESMLRPPKYEHR